MNVRALTSDDFDALRALMATDEEHFYDRPSHLEVGDIREWLVFTDIAHDTCVFVEDGEFCAAGWAFRPPATDVAIALGAVHPRWKGRGLGAELVARLEVAANRLDASRLHQTSLAPDAGAAELFTGRGYREVRRFYEMAIEVTEPPAVPAVPIEVLREGEAQAFHAALDEAFQDHWEHRSASFEEWWHRHSSNPSFDASLWFLIREGEEIAAVCRNEANRNGGGYVGAIGVRRPWRGKGYAKALLLHTFREFHDRGISRVTLGVDATNPTGATHLYERVGMHVELEYVVYEKPLA
jgi:GNAT superfamily N-acetyltransferase